MYILYICVIIFFCAVLIGLYFFFYNRDKQRYEKLHNNLSKKEEQTQTETADTQTEEKAKAEPVSEAEAELEDFSLDDPVSEDKSVKSNSLNDFGMRSDEDVDRKFSNYEEFLRKNLGNFDFEEDDKKDKFKKNFEYDDDDEDENDKFDLDFASRHRAAPQPKTTFSFDDFKGKSKDEISDMLKDLPPRVQELMMEDVMRRRSLEEDDEEED